MSNFLNILNYKPDLTSNVGFICTGYFTKHANNI
jgi:hypothetical protein